MISLTIIIPTFNRPNKLNRTLNLLNKNNHKFNIIVIDDGSSLANRYENKKICQSFINVNYYWQNNSGPSQARQLGLLKAQTKYISFLDCDDYISIDCINEICFLLEKEDKYDYVTIQSQYVDDIEKSLLLTCTQQKQTSKEIKNSLLNTIIELIGFPINSISGWNQSNCIYRREKILKIYKVRNLSWAEDIPLKIMVNRHLHGLSIKKNNASLIEISHGRGYKYSLKQIINLAKEINNNEDKKMINLILSTIIVLRYTTSMLIKKLKG
ncbi:glycosyl transferase [Proteus vulgaris]|uniref:Glycosyl transferase n=1 Tax=Proteus vulgaris TaxID=585 RepID=A0A379F8L5_PROVU|nr:glycosyltransferase family 2 protein [Proteus vulgaris]SUC15931.1 glycosyl transferase [Proteus vulgaris]